MRGKQLLLVKGYLGSSTPYSRTFACSSSLVVSHEKKSSNMAYFARLYGVPHLHIILICRSGKPVHRDIIFNLSADPADSSE